MAHKKYAMQRAQRSVKKEQPHAALLWSRGYKNHLELLRYAAPVGLISHGLTWVYVKSSQVAYFQ
jgi:hypothetical protein